MPFQQGEEDGDHAGATLVYLGESGEEPAEFCLVQCICSGDNDRVGQEQLEETAAWLLEVCSVAPLETASGLT